ncbi:hypothetical protein NP493_543g02016 [Ridgeia piscesae]|uniref:Uncharacterized protein n=1 Tax=Ridgeia piscesae TaxID=27915 RepID=A0AAD9NS06_RIDPI|nr:hypothetical protein NP493_543g02016 [Ridgeia piscesae]
MNLLHKKQHLSLLDRQREKAVICLPISAVDASSPKPHIRTASCRGSPVKALQVNSWPSTAKPSYQTGHDQHAAYRKSYRQPTTDHVDVCSNDAGIRRTNASLQLRK